MGVPEHVVDHRARGLFHMHGRAVELRLGGNQRAGDALEGGDTGIDPIRADGEFNHGDLHEIYS